MSAGRRRSLIVYNLGGRICGYGHFYQPPDDIDKLRRGILAAIPNHFAVTVAPRHSTGEMPIYKVVDEMAAALADERPPEVLVLCSLQGMIDIVERMVQEQQSLRQPDSTIIMLGSPYLLGYKGDLGDERGETNQEAVRKALAGPVAPAASTWLSPFRLLGYGRRSS